MPDAYSYVRFSTEEQKRGTSQKAQEAAIDKWLAENDTYTLVDEKKDLGLSGFSGKHVQKGELKDFLDYVEDGGVKPGSVLLVWRFDRLSRLPVRQTQTLVNKLLDNDISIITLDDGQWLTPANNNAFQSILIALKAEQAWQESSKKSAAVATSYVERRKITDERKVTSLAPSWLKPVRIATVEKTKKKLITTGFTVIKEKADVVRLIFKAAAEGKSITQIVKILVEKEIKPFRSKVCWNYSTVHYLIRGQTVLGHYQPTKNNKPLGKPFYNYYPAIIDQALYDAANHALNLNKTVRGNHTGRKVYLFDGLLYSENDNCKLYHCNGSYYSKNRRLNLKNSCSIGVRCDVLEKVLLLALEELKTIKNTKGRKRKINADAQIQAQYSKIEELEKELDSASAGTVATILQQIERTRKQIEELNEEKTRRHEKIKPIKRNYKDRVSLRAAIRMVVKKVIVLVHKEKGGQNSANVIMYLHDGTERHCFIWVKKARPKNDITVEVKGNEEKTVAVLNSFGMASYSSITEELVDEALKRLFYADQTVSQANKFVSKESFVRT